MTQLSKTAYLTILIVREVGLWFWSAERDFVVFEEIWRRLESIRVVFLTSQTQSRCRRGVEEGWPIWLTWTWIKDKIRNRLLIRHKKKKRRRIRSRSSIGEGGPFWLTRTWIRDKICNRLAIERIGRRKRKRRRRRRRKKEEEKKRRKRKRSKRNRGRQIRSGHQI